VRKTAVQANSRRRRVKTGKYKREALRDGSRPSKKEPYRSTNSASISLGLCKIVKNTRDGGSKHTMAERTIVETVANRSP